jgi:hypothetical protein
MSALYFEVFQSFVKLFDVANGASPFIVIV